MSVPLKARREFVYAGHRVKRGEDFDARSASDARLLKAIGHAEDQTVAVAPAPQPYATRMMTAAAPAPVFPRQSIDDLDGMDADALHALADRLGVYVHHRAGAERARQVIREHRKQSAE